MAPTDRSGDGPDLLEGGPGRASAGRSRRWALGVGAAVLIGLVIGYAAGHSRAPTRTVRVTVPPISVTHRARSSLPVFGPSFAQTGATCSVQHGRHLQLGIQVKNQTSTIVHITGVGTREPIGGLRPLTSRVGVCGQASGLPVSYDPSAVPPGAATWLTATMQVLVRCPAPDPVQFVVHYQRGDRQRADPVGGFVDLGHVPYTGCARSGR